MMLSSQLSRCPGPGSIACTSLHSWLQGCRGQTLQPTGRCSTLTPGMQACCRSSGSPDQIPVFTCNLCRAGMLLVFWLFGIPQLSGERLAALAALLALFALASLPLTYLVHFLFKVHPASCACTVLVSMPLRSSRVCSAFPQPRGAPWSTMWLWSGAADPRRAQLCHVLTAHGCTACNPP